MISRTYICRLPDNGAVNLDIAVRNTPGTRAAPVGTGGVVASAANGAYYELRGRAIRFEQLALTPAATANPAFTRRANLGWRIAAYIYGGAAVTESPVFLLSNSIVQALASTEVGGPIIAPATLADPAYGPTLRVVNHANLVARIFIVHFDIMEQKDDDRSPAGSV
jgi:hypothetical protein